MTTALERAKSWLSQDAKSATDTPDYADALVLDLRNFRRNSMDALYTALVDVYYTAEANSDYECSDHVHELLLELEVHPRLSATAKRRR
jgi:hypothetical protein